MWQGINNITGFKGNKPATVNIAAFAIASFFPQAIRLMNSQK